MRSLKYFSFVFFLSLATYRLLQIPVQAKSLRVHSFKYSPFSISLETLQIQINYKFQSIELLRGAATHASYSEENNRALSVLGASVIETSVSLSALSNDIDTSANDLNNRITEISKVETSCAPDGMRLGLQKIVRVSPKTNSSTPSIVCGTFREIFGAIAIDKQSSDEAGSVFWYVHGGGSKRVAM